MPVFRIDPLNDLRVANVAGRMPALRHIGKARVNISKPRESSWAPSRGRTSRMSARTHCTKPVFRWAARVWRGGAQLVAVRCRRLDVRAEIFNCHKTFI